MQLNSFMISGPKGSLEELLKALRAEPQAAALIIGDPAEEPAWATPRPVRVHQPWELAEAIWLVTITLPIGVAAEMIATRLDDWLRVWLRSRADAVQVRVQEVPGPSGPDGKRTTDN